MTAVESREGAYVSQVATRVVELGVELIVVPPPKGRSGAMITEPARAAGAPVLVARAPASREVIVSSSDITDARCGHRARRRPAGAGAGGAQRGPGAQGGQLVALEAADVLAPSRLEQLEGAAPSWEATPRRW